MATTLPPTETTQPATTDLGARFPGIVTADTRPNYKGWILPKENFVEVATAIRDEFGYDMLATVTGVDYFPENKMEVVYHAYKTTGGPGLVFKVQVPRDDPVEVPSLIDEIPALSVLGVRCGFEISGAQELRLKESDRIHAIVSNLMSLGIHVDERPDGVHLSYDRMASLLAPYKNAAALKVARELDAKVEALLASAAA